MLSAVPRDSASAGQEYCDYSERRVLILIDRTTEYDDQDRQIFADGLGRVFDGLGVGDEVIVHTIEDSHTASKQVFRECYPGCPDVGVVDWLIGACRAMMARKDRLDFQKGLARLGREMLSDVASFPHSDIAQTIGAVSRTYASVERPITQLYVFSDMIENSREWPWPTIIRRNPASFMKQLDDAGITPRFSDAIINVFGFGRFHDKGRRALQSSERARLIAFWTRFFGSGAANQVYIGLRLD